MKKLTLLLITLSVATFTACTPEYIEPIVDTLTASSEANRLKSGDIITLNGKTPTVIVMRNDEKVDVALSDIDPKDITHMHVIKTKEGALSFNPLEPFNPDGLVIIHLKDWLLFD